MSEPSIPEVREQILVPTDKVTKTFKAHMEPSNKRIIFSAPFGAGKSFFLEQFFQNQPDLLSIRLHPIDYAVANNEDIFELMKHDIIEALMENYGEQLDLKKEDFSKLLLLQEFIRNRMDVSAIGKAIFNTIIPNGENVNKVVDEVKKLKESFNEFSAEVSEDQGERLIEYLAELKTRKGSIRENDAITQIIKDYVQRIRSANDGKRFVFILDDLDRLDPEHLFRLFNVFTAHQDSRTDQNKFDFDHVIFVCDIKNIHHMFRHKYGKEVDFSGYIDKFYSSHIFNFDFKEYLKGTVKKHLAAKYEFSRLELDGLPSHLHDSYDFKNKPKANDWGNFLEFFIGLFIQYDFVKIRSFQRFQTYHIPVYEFSPLKSRNFQAYNYPFLVLIATVQQFFPRLNELEGALEFLSSQYPADYNTPDNRYYYENEYAERTLIELCIPFLMPAEDAFGSQREENEKTFRFANESGELMEFTYDLGWNNNIRLRQIQKLQETEELKFEIDPSQGYHTVLVPVAIKQPNPYWFLLCAFKSCRKLEFLRD